MQEAYRNLDAFLDSKLLWWGLGLEQLDQPGDGCFSQRGFSRLQGLLCCCSFNGLPAFLLELLSRELCCLFQWSVCRS